MADPLVTAGATLVTNEGAAREERTALVLPPIVRTSALAAAGLTVVGGVTLGAFFAVGEPWGTINDLAAIALSTATVPIAVGLRAAAERPRPIDDVALGADLVGATLMIGGSGVLVSGLGSFESTLPAVLSGQALTGVWLLLTGVGFRPQLRRSTRFAAVAGGAGLIGVGAGTALRGLQHPITAVAGLTALIGTTAFYALLGTARSARSG